MTEKSQPIHRLGDEPQQHSQWESAKELREQWYVACSVDEMRGKKVRAITILGLGLVLFRGASGQLSALIDQCVHRGTALSAGRINDGCLECPYHGWRYDASGRVVHIPSVDGPTTPVEPHRFRQRAFDVAVMHGLIWVYLGEKDTDQSEIFEMPFHDTPGWVSYYMKSTFNGNVSALAQNFMDVPHTVYVHNKIFRKSPGKIMRTTVNMSPNDIEVVYEDNGDSIGMMPWLMNPDRVPLVHTDRFIAPNATRCDYHWGSKSGFVITSQITPVDEHTSRVYTLIAYRFPWPGFVSKLLKPFIHIYTRIVLEQDIRIVKYTWASNDLSKPRKTVSR